MTAGRTTNHRDFNLLCNYSRMSCWHQFVSSWRNKHFLWQSVCSVGEHLNQDVSAGCLNAGKLCSREELMRLPLCRVSEDVTSRLRLITDIVFLLVSVESCTRSVPTRPEGRHRRRILFKISLTSVSLSSCLMETVGKIWTSRRLLSSAHADRRAWEESQHIIYTFLLHPVRGDSCFPQWKTGSVQSPCGGWLLCHYSDCSAETSQTSLAPQRFDSWL